MSEEKKEETKTLTENDLEKVAGGDPTAFQMECKICHELFWVYGGGSDGICPKCVK